MSRHRAGGHDRVMTDESPTGRALSPQQSSQSRQSQRSGEPAPPLRRRRSAGGRAAAGTGGAARSTKADWLVPAALIMLSAVPMVAGAARLTELTGGAEITPENARFFAAPLPVVLHIVSVSLYSVLGAFQF